MHKSKSCGFIDGSFTVEAALGFPVFLFVALALIFILQIMRIEKNINYGLLQAAKAASMYAYTGVPIDNRTDTVYLQAFFLENINKDLCSDSFIDGGYMGISFLQSVYRQEEEKIKITASYRLHISLPFIEISGLKRQQTVQTRAFVGKTLCPEGLDEEEQLVYVTENATVYHKSKDCSHLKLKIEELCFGEVAARRNIGGGKYKLCERCGRSGLTESNIIYIADYGDRYHCSRNCSGLKRSIRTIKKSQVTGLHACSRCGS